jgi:Undecaprenyl-phosphate glucose phosphotransferase
MIVGEQSEDSVATGIETLDRLFEMGRRPAPLSQAVLAGVVLGCDIAATVVPAVIVNLAYHGMGSSILGENLAVVGLAVLLFVLGAHASGLYRFPAIMRPERHVARILALCAAVFLVLVGLAFALKVSTEFSRVWAFASMLGAMVLVVSIRFVFAGSLKNFARAGRIARKIVIYGAEEHGRKLIERIAHLDEPWNRIVGVFDDRLTRVGSTVAGQPILGNLSDLIAWGRAHRPDEVLLALPWNAEARLIQILQQLAVLPANVRLCSEFMRLDLVEGRMNYQFGVPMLNAFEKPVEGWGRIWKRAFDVAIAGAILVMTAPFLLLISALIKLESPGPVLFRQPRHGFNNNLIDVFKFRTMRAMDTLGDRLTEHDDPRVTRIGAVLRRFSLDELPQLLNVLRGEMSLVGPRPHAIRTTAGSRQCNEVVAEYAVRHKVKPGMTGWAQVNGWRGTMMTEEQLVRRVEHDLFYIKNWSPWLDVKILAMTLVTVLIGTNSF